MKAFILAMALLLSASLAVAAETQTLVSDAWVREAPPGASMLAGYLTIENPSDEDLVLVDVSSPRFARVMMHRSEMVDGMARMIHEESITIPAHGKTEFKPGSYHLMMPAPDLRLTTGDPVPFVLRFANGEQLEVSAEVRKP